MHFDTHFCFCFSLIFRIFPRSRQSINRFHSVWYKPFQDSKFNVSIFLVSGKREGEEKNWETPPSPQWTRVNLNSNRTDPCAGLCHVRQVQARPYPMQARFQLWWRGQTFYSTRPIIMKNKNILLHVCNIQIQVLKYRFSSTNTGSYVQLQK